MRIRNTRWVTRKPDEDTGRSTLVSAKHFPAMLGASCLRPVSCMHSPRCARYVSPARANLAYYATSEIVNYEIYRRRASLGRPLPAFSKIRLLLPNASSNRPALVRSVPVSALRGSIFRGSQRCSKLHSPPSAPYPDRSPPRPEHRAWR